MSQDKAKDLKQVSRGVLPAWIRYYHAELECPSSTRKAGFRELPQATAEGNEGQGLRQLAKLMGHDSPLNLPKQADYLPLALACAGWLIDLTSVPAGPDAVLPWRYRYDQAT